MKLSHSLVLTLPVLSGWATAADLSVKFEIPQLNVAEYHRPYVAMWIERADQSVAANLTVLYDIKKKDNAGTKWLKDMRTWWRKAGRDMTSYDGISGATRAAGEQTISFGPKPVSTSCLQATTNWSWKRRVKRAGANSCGCRSRGRPKAASSLPVRPAKKNWAMSPSPLPLDA
jgi:hypothetical protein